MKEFFKGAWEKWLGTPAWVRYGFVSFMSFAFGAGFF